MATNSATKTQIYDSSRRGSPAWDELREVVNYRNLILQLARRDVLTRYKRSFLGIAWTMLNPLGMTIVLTLAFSHVFRFNIEGGAQGYPSYVLSGLMAWNFFAQTTTASMVNLVWGGNLLHRIYIPRSSFALAAMGTGLINLTIGILPVLLVMWVTGVPIHPSILFLPIPMLLLMCFSLGMGLLISTFAVYFPDVAEMYQIALTAWMYLTPIVYPETILPPAYQFWITRINPMYYLVKLYRIPLYFGKIPNWQELAPAVLISVTILALGWYLFSLKSDEFAYRI